MVKSPPSTHPLPTEVRLPQLRKRPHWYVANHKHNEASQDIRQWEDVNLHTDTETVPSSPSDLPRSTNDTMLPFCPPKVISDKTGKFCFERLGYLGEGGSARVYEVKDINHIGGRAACKIISKGSLDTIKSRNKLLTEISIHRSLKHPNIVNFHESFEDKENVYITLELCSNGSLMDMLARRRRLTEPETRFFMVQLIGACHYIHLQRVVHRNLYPGNLYLDKNMNLKVGSFGLATRVESSGDKRKAVYVSQSHNAPELLFNNGNSFAIDTWIIGAVLYTLIVGSSPFEAKENTYKRIRANEYKFPMALSISSAAQYLVQWILNPNPFQRPTLHEIVDDKFFTQGPVPSHIPPSALNCAPDFGRISKSTSSVNLKRLRKESLVDYWGSGMFPTLPFLLSMGGGQNSQHTPSLGVNKELPEIRDVPTKVEDYERLPKVMDTSVGTHTGVHTVAQWSDKLASHNAKGVGNMPPEIEGPRSGYSSGKRALSPTAIFPKAFRPRTMRESPEIKDKNIGSSSGSPTSPTPATPRFTSGPTPTEEKPDINRVIKTTVSDPKIDSDLPPSDQATISVYSKASSRTVSTDYGLFYTRRAYSQLEDSSNTSSLLAKEVEPHCAIQN